MVNDSTEPAAATIRFTEPPRRLTVGDAEIAVDRGRARLEFTPLEVKMLRWGG